MQRDVLVCEQFDLRHDSLQTYKTTVGRCASVKKTGPSNPTRASKPPQECDAWCQLLAKWLKVSAIRERPIQRYSEVLGLGAEGQGFVVEVEF